jgi:hypothetical protein
MEWHINKNCIIIFLLRLLALELNLHYFDEVIGVAGIRDPLSRGLSRATNLETSPESQKSNKVISIETAIRIKYSVALQPMNSFQSENNRAIGQELLQLGKILLLI